ncbi:nucleosome assembly protein 1-like 1-like [Trifolium pratense]|uniref:Nucleosome assembly protein 1-like 1-like n=1 Tax=Trifolium pratense TaxID=57577 RepID=A0A2K3JQA3_TRIPR|nr:nucleosome assembly protein 1-like 1-like [Trifolium pratense]
MHLIQVNLGEVAHETEIEWHPGKCLTHKLLKKPKKRSRNTKGIINTEKCESFFNFFNPPQTPEDDDDDDDIGDDDDVEELEFLIERDFKIGYVTSEYLGVMR